MLMRQNINNDVTWDSRTARARRNVCSELRVPTFCIVFYPLVFVVYLEKVYCCVRSLPLIHEPGMLLVQSLCSAFVPGPLGYTR